VAWGDQTPSWTEAQLLTAARIVHQCRQHRAQRGADPWVVAAALAESDCLVLSSDAVPASQTSPWRQGNSPGDHLSVGCLQQQPWWGQLENLMSPYGAAQRFLTGGDDGSPGLLSDRNWRLADQATSIARVQKDASGGAAYAPHLADAHRICGIFAASR
jgi:hypothetical protein